MVLVEVVARSGGKKRLVFLGEEWWEKTSAVSFRRQLDCKLPKCRCM
jgi:hypothetical protein